MTVMTAPGVQNTTRFWEHTARAAMHPTAIHILLELAAAHDTDRGDRSPVDLATVLAQPLGSVAYHVRMLRDRGLIAETRRVPVRGALQHFYALAEGMTE